jgi:hypothetical protein
MLRKLYRRSSPPSKRFSYKAHRDDSSAAAAAFCDNGSAVELFKVVVHNVVGQPAVPCVSLRARTLGAWSGGMGRVNGRALPPVLYVFSMLQRVPCVRYEVQRAG